MDPQSGRERGVLTTPIDACLPLLIALLVVCAWLSRGTRWSAAVACAVPLLIAVMMTIPHERTRRVAYGVVVATEIGVTAAALERGRPAGAPPPMMVLAVVGIILVRWIPFRDVHVIKELIVMAGSIALLFSVILSDQRRVPKMADDSAGADARRRVAQYSPRLGRGTRDDQQFRGREGGRYNQHSDVVAAASAAAKSNDHLVPRAEREAELLRAPSRTNVGDVEVPQFPGNRQRARSGERPPFMAALLAVLFLAAVTPIPPGKMALLPLVVAALVFVTRRIPSLAIAAVFFICAYFARYSLATIYLAVGIVFLVPLLDRIRPLAYGAALVVFALWPWSGIIARALPVVSHFQEPGQTQPIAWALVASQSLPIGVPPHVRHAVITASGGQMARFRTGHVLGTIEATDSRGRVTRRAIAIGDVADFGFTRREQFFASRNPMPRSSPGEIRDYGAKAWLWGAGRIGIASAEDMTQLRVIAASDLPPQAHLQIDSVEFPPR